MAMKTKERGNVKRNSEATVERTSTQLEGGSDMHGQTEKT